MHELVAHEAGIPMGEYHHFTNNLHAYPDMPRYEEIFWDRNDHDLYRKGVETIPILKPEEKYEDLVEDSYELTSHGDMELRTRWMKEVAYPIYMAWQSYKQEDYLERDEYLDTIAAEDWRIACKGWMTRRDAKRSGQYVAFDNE
jgi:hypothetical protein